MDPNEVFEYVTEGMKWLSIGGGTYIATLASLNGILRLFSEKISSQDDLDRITAEETEKLGMTRQVTPKFHENHEESARKLDDGTYEINIGGFGARRTQVRHELYHVHRGHCDDRRRIENGLINNLDYLFRREPQAIAYEVLKLKL